MTPHDHDPRKGNCRQIFERLSDYIDGELPEGLCDDLERHLDDCPPCQAFLESLRRTVAWVGADDAPELPEHLRRELGEAYRAYRRERG